MAIYYVEATGSNTFPFSSRATAATNFHNLLVAISQIASDDIVYLNGLVTEPDDYGYYYNDGSIIGNDPLVDRINMKSCTFDSIDSTTFRASYIDIGMFTDSSNAFVFIYSPALVRHCRFDGSDFAYMAIASSGSSPIFNVDLICNVFNNFRDIAVQINFGGYSRPSDAVRIIGNSFNNSLGIQFYCINVSLGSLLIYDNAVNNGNKVMAYPLRVQYNTSTITSFIHTNNVSTGYQYLNDGTPVSPDLTELVADPLFLGVDPDPLAIDNTSPCYHSGVTDALLTEDILGTPYFNPPSIGAYEVASTFRVYYDGNGSTGGTAPVDPTNYSLQDAAEILGAGTLVKENATFYGWAPENNYEFYQPGDFYRILVEQDVTFYAVWENDPIIGGFLGREEI